MAETPHSSSEVNQMAFAKSQRRAIVLVISFLVFVTVTTLRLFITGWIGTLNLYVFTYALSGFIVAYIWAEESWSWGLWLVTSLWGVMVISLLFSDFYSLEFVKNIVPLFVATIAACFGAFLGAKVSLRN